MKRLFMLLLMLCLLFSSAWAQTEADFSYSIVDGKAKITGYTGSASDLILPDTLGGYPVTAINYCAFRNCASLTRVTIPDGVTVIGSNAFQNCSSLTQILIPDSVKRIDTHAFYGCSALTQLALHDDLDRIHALAFYGCSAARYCSLDSRTAYVLTDVGYSFCDPQYPQLVIKAFEDDAGMRTFTVDHCDASAVTISVPDGVTLIEGQAFFGCAALTEVTLPDSVGEIAYSAFEGCTALRRITIPGNTVQIASDAFSGCSNLTIIAPKGSTGQALAEANAARSFTWQPL